MTCILYCDWYITSNLLSNNHGIGAPVTGGGTAGTWTQEKGFMAYYEICLNIKNNGWLSVKGDDCTVGPYAYKGNQWVGYDDESSVKIKVSPSL